MTEHEPDSPAQLLAAAAAAGQRTRAARHAFWFPLVLFGVVVILAAPWYADPVPNCPPGLRFCVSSHVLPSYSPGQSLYWAIGAGLGYPATLVWYRHHARRVGVAGRIWPYLAAGLALLALTMLFTPAVGGRLLHDAFLRVPRLHELLTTPTDLSIRGMMPLLALAVGLFVLARLERSLPLAGFALLFLVVALVANLSYVSNQTSLIGWTPSAEWTLLPNLWLAGFTLLLGGIGFGLAGPARDRARDRGAARSQGTGQERPA